MEATGKNVSLDERVDAIMRTFGFDDGVDDVAKQKNKELQKAMIDAGLNQTTLAEASGLHLTNVNAVVNGSIPHLRTAQRIVKALRARKVDVSIDDLWPLPEEE